MWCGNRRRHETWEQAREAARKAVTDGQAARRVYPCPDCNGFHLTSRVSGGGRRGGVVCRARLVRVQGNGGP